jgi:hypothetical protein
MSCKHFTCLRSKRRLVQDWHSDSKYAPFKAVHAGHVAFHHPWSSGPRVASTHRYRSSPHVLSDFMTPIQSKRFVIVLWLFIAPDFRFPGLPNSRASHKDDSRKFWRTWPKHAASFYGFFYILEAVDSAWTRLFPRSCMTDRPTEPFPCGILRHLQYSSISHRKTSQRFINNSWESSYVGCLMQNQ